MARDALTEIKIIGEREYIFDNLKRLRVKITFL